MEVCVDSVVSAVNAARGGASRLELCAALSEGGLTPTPGLLEIVKSCVKVPVFVMLRPRTGSDFVFSGEEARIIKCDAAVLKKHGADGFVFGALTADGRIDEVLCKDVVEIVAPLPVTFHRAIDVVKNPVCALETIVQLGFARVLTSGGERTAYAGLQVIRELMVAAGGRITIMPGAGINSDNLAPILEVTGAREFHVSGRVPLKISWNQSKCMMGVGDDNTIYVTSYEVVAQLWDIYRQTIVQN
ncbi:copper homeostasis protein cutC homolog [Bacillus rossius redtenbacheri]|uniref:copper homeostasis protein cutC homolog n=1 Tax=Bacillus rossius redtenbacheri TaxID=93214 RepID=UPI002FDD2065